MFLLTRIYITLKEKGQREIIAILDSSINFLPIFNLAFNLISFMTLILSTYVLQDIVSLESPWICSTVPKLNEWILCFWLQLTLYLILIICLVNLHKNTATTQLKVHLQASVDCFKWNERMCVSLKHFKFQMSLPLVSVISN